MEPALFLRETSYCLGLVLSLSVCSLWLPLEGSRHVDGTCSFPTVLLWAHRSLFFLSFYSVQLLARVHLPTSRCLYPGCTLMNCPGNTLSLDEEEGSVKIFLTHHKNGVARGSDPIRYTIKVRPVPLPLC